LEFLGDAVLDMCVAELLFHSFPNEKEGRLTKMRALIVSSHSLAPLARSLGLGPLLHLGPQERTSDGEVKDSILADAFEAVIGATLLVSGIDEVRSLIRQLFVPLLEKVALDQILGDYKSALQESVVSTGVPVYHDSWEGPDHARRYRSEVVVNGATLGVGEGISKRAAQQDAARVALEALKGNRRTPNA
jgi:ribonuclease-3